VSSSPPEELLGKRVLVGVTCVDEDGETIDRFQTHGLVSEVGEHWIVLTRSDGGEFGVPRELEPAEPGEYRLRETGEVVVDPDFLARWTVTISPGSSPADVRAGGFAR
jgi:hypothetical protein